jgi:hypothetical protein
LETSERKWYVKKGPSVQRTKGEKRDHPIEPVLSGLIRRRFLIFLGTGSAALAAGSASALTSCAQSEEQGSKDQEYKNGKSASTAGKTGGKPTYFQPVEFSDTDELIPPEGCCYEVIRRSGDASTTNRVCGDHNDYVAYSAIDALEDSEDSEDGIHWVNHEYVNSIFWSDYTDPKSQTKEQVAWERAWRLARVKSILAASRRRDWEADGPRLWLRKGDTELRIVDLTDDDGRVDLDEEWARSAVADSVAFRVELSICHGWNLLAKVPAVCLDSGRAFIPWPREDEYGRLMVARWQYDLCRVISPGEYLGAYPVNSYLRRVDIAVI